MMSKNNRKNREKKKRQKLAKQKTRRASTNDQPTAAKTAPNITVPAAITDEIAAFCTEIAPTGAAQYVDVKPARKAKVNDCFLNAQAFEKEKGGSVRYGWNVMEWPGVLLEAEFHAVWRSPSGELLDVTPRRDAERRILFLPDDARAYDGSYTPSKQRALATAPPEAAAYIDACQEKWAFMARHFVDDGLDGCLSLTTSDELKFMRLQAAHRDAHSKLVTACAERMPSPVNSAGSSTGGTAGGISRADINRIARSISTGPMGLAHHRPQHWASPHHCYNNAMGMVSREGGRVRCGWTFHVRTKPGVGDYVVCTPHAVWHNPRDLSLVDVTPHPNPFHAPEMQDGSVVFLVNKAAEPVVVTDNVILSPALRFFAVGDSLALAEYVAELNAQAVSDFERDKRDALMK